MHLIGGCGHFVAAAALSEYWHVSVRIGIRKLNQIKLFFLGNVGSKRGYLDFAESDQGVKDK